ncbi:MAG: Crp/Fnr family transcriptional regulator [Polynucleobacter sp.]|uniref:Crp/Fnr family transcriptional regulator n=1 Tax=Polynucleobacter sp. TaxID=2029855 RepID=UPI002724920E|nr:Crp/Fnr family transcriptional regulator [Polynucleobacter sp.]MDO8714045.1 Crp/Fnr family transcriptional regulator [Polynucleobacter sp.]
MSQNIPQTLLNLLPSKVLDLCKQRVLSKGEMLFKQGAKPETLFYIVSGEAVLSRISSHGESTILQRRKTGFLSEASLLSEKYHCDAFATQSGLAITIPIQTIHNALKESDFAIKWVALLSREIMRLRTQSERLGLKDIKSKLLHLIETEGTQGTLTLQSDFKSLASEIGVTHEALYRTISALEKDGTLIKTLNSLQLAQKKGC